MGRIKTFALFESDAIPNEWKMLTDLARELNDTFRNYGYEFTIRDTHATRYGFFGKCIQLSKTILNYAEDDEEFEAKGGTEGRLGVYEITPGDSECLLRTLLCNIVLGMDSRKVAELFINSDFDFKNSEYLFIRYSPDVKEYDPSQLDNCVFLVPQDMPIGQIKREFTKAINANLEGIKSFLCVTFPHGEYYKEHNSREDIDIAKSLIDSFVASPMMGPQLKMGIHNVLGKLPDARLNDTCVEMASLIYDGFEIPKYLKTRGWTDEEINEMELLRRMKKRAKYT